MRDQPFPSHRDRSVQVIERPNESPDNPYIVWCGEEQRVVNAYDERIDAETAAFVHQQNGTWHR